jgi:hypothetical protein
MLPTQPWRTVQIPEVSLYWRLQVVWTRMIRKPRSTSYQLNSSKANNILVCRDWNRVLLWLPGLLLVVPICRCKTGKLTLT